jgi:protoporphyrinogen oxidase
MSSGYLFEKGGILIVKKTEELRERNAYHEAGHVVMDLLLMLTFEAVSVKRVERPNYLYKNGQTLPINNNVIEEYNTSNGNNR